MEPSKRHGVFRVGSRLVGVALENISEVCVVPRLSSLMTPGPIVLGAFDLRGALVPVLDLESLSGLAPRSVETKTAAILKYEGRMTAIALDGIVNLARSRLTEISYQGAESSQAAYSKMVFKRGFWSENDVVSELDIASLFARDDILTIQDTRQKSKREHGQETQKLLIFSSGQARFSIDANNIFATVPRQRIDAKEIGGQQEPFLGFISHQSWRVPVVHANMVLGVGGIERIDEAEVALLRFPNEKLIGLAVESMEKLVSVADVDLKPSSPLVAKTGILGSVFADRNGNQTHVINIEALTTRSDLIEISELTRRKEAARINSKEDDTKGKDIVRERDRYLVFEAGRTLAVPAAQIVRILKKPDQIIPSPTLHPLVEGLFEFNNRSIPLARIDSSNASQGTSHILLVGPQDYQVGFAVDKICSLQTSNWRSKNTNPMPGSEALVQVSDGGKKTVLPITNLLGLAEAIAGAP